MRSTRIEPNATAGAITLARERSQNPTENVGRVATTTVAAGEEGEGRSAGIEIAEQEVASWRCLTTQRLRTFPRKRGAKGVASQSPVADVMTVVTT